MKHYEVALDEVKEFSLLLSALFGRYENTLFSLSMNQEGELFEPLAYHSYRSLDAAVQAAKQLNEKFQMTHGTLTEETNDVAAVTG